MRLDGRRALPGVVEQVGEHLVEPVGVAVDPAPPFGRQLELDGAVGPSARAASTAMRTSAAEVEGSNTWTSRPTSTLCVSSTSRVIAWSRRALDARAATAVRRSSSSIPSQWSRRRLEEPEHAGHRRAQLVRDDRDELLLCLAELPQPLLLRSGGPQPPVEADREQQAGREEPERRGCGRRSERRRRATSELVVSCGTRRATGGREPRRCTTTCRRSGGRRPGWSRRRSSAEHVPEQRRSRSTRHTDPCRRRRGTRRSRRAGAAPISLLKRCPRRPSSRTRSCLAAGQESVGVHRRIGITWRSTGSSVVRPSPSGSTPPVSSLALGDELVVARPLERLADRPSSSNRTPWVMVPWRPAGRSRCAGSGISCRNPLQRLEVGSGLFSVRSNG